MTFEINLVVTGVDTLSEDFDESPASEFEDVQWRSVAGVTIASLYTDGDPVMDACTFSRRLESSGAGKVESVYDDFVNISEIALRLDVNRQTVRLWVDGARGPGNFPPPVHTHGSLGEKGAMKVWRWAEVNSWLASLGLEDGVDHLTRRQAIEIEAHVHRLAEPVGTAWAQAVKRETDTTVQTALAAIAAESISLKQTLADAEGLAQVIVLPVRKALAPTAKDSTYRMTGRPGTATKVYK